GLGAAGHLPGAGAADGRDRHGPPRGRLQSVASGQKLATERWQWAVGREQSDRGLAPFLTAAKKCLHAGAEGGLYDDEGGSCGAGPGYPGWRRAGTATLSAAPFLVGATPLARRHRHHQSCPGGSTAACFALHWGLELEKRSLTATYCGVPIPEPQTHLAPAA